MLGRFWPWFAAKATARREPPLNESGLYNPVSTALSYLERDHPPMVVARRMTARQYLVWRHQVVNEDAGVGGRQIVITGIIIGSHDIATAR